MRLPSTLRLARLRAAARGRIEVRGAVRVGPRVRVAVAPGARVVLEAGSALGEGCRIEAAAGLVHVGAGAQLGERSVVVARERVEIGAGAVVGDWALVCDTEPRYDDPERPTRLQPVRTAPVRIGERARVGVHATVLPGGDVGAGAVLAPYATAP